MTDEGATKRASIADRLKTVVSQIRGRDKSKPVLFENIFNQIHASSQVLALGDTEYKDEAIVINTTQTHGLFSNFDWRVNGSALLPASASHLIPAARRDVVRHDDGDDGADRVALGGGIQPTRRQHVRCSPAAMLSAWLLYSVAAATIQMLLPHELPEAFAATILFTAGAFQFAPLKRACLMHCRNPLTYFLIALARRRVGQLPHGHAPRPVLRRLLLGADGHHAGGRRDEPLVDGCPRRDHLHRAGHAMGRTGSCCGRSWPALRGDLAHLICAGEAFEDLIFVGLDHVPELGEEVKTDHFMSTIGGGVVITAVKAARLGMKTTVISALSDDACARLKKERVSVTNLRKKGEPHAITAALSTGQDRAFVTYNGVNAKLEPRLARTDPEDKGEPCSFLLLSARLRSVDADRDEVALTGHHHIVGLRLE